MDSTPLYETISRHLDQAFLARIASEYEKGRLLLIQTTDLDAGRPVLWNIGAIAASGDPRALNLVRHILLASASIPAAFPPVMFDVEVNGRSYQEMHVDGGAVKPWRRMAPGIAMGGLFERVLIKGPHISRIEVFGVLGVEIASDEGQIKGRSRSLSHQIHAVEVAHAIVIDER